MINILLGYCVFSYTLIIWFAVGELKAGADVNVYGVMCFILAPITVLWYALLFTAYLTFKQQKGWV